MFVYILISKLYKICLHILFIYLQVPSETINLLMRKQQQPSSFLYSSEGAEPEEEHIQKQQSQFKALFIKNAILQSKQMGTNLCQIFTPIICLIFTYLMKTIAQQNLQITFTFDDNYYPYRFNDFAKYDELNPVGRNPTQYYLIDCIDETGCNRTFMGVNDGQNRSGMMDNIGITRQSITFTPDPYDNPEQTLTLDAPFFPQANISVNNDAFNRLTVVGTRSFQIIKNGSGKDYIPDGAITFKKLDNQTLQAEIKVDDCRDLEYHRTNGISKNRQLKRIEKQEIQAVIVDFTQAYGLLHIMHIATSAFIEQITPNNVVVEGGFLLMPDSDNQNSFIDTIINSVSSLVFPLGLSLLFPVFLYSIVLQKEERLVQMMKMNGLKIRYFWLNFFVFNLMLCVITNVLFFTIGTFALQTTFFVKTSKVLLTVVAFGWCLAQIGMAAFFQTFLSDSRSANIIGYLISIWTSMIGSTLCLGVYQYPSAFPLPLQMFPPFAFVRIFYLMMMECSNGDCYFDIGNISDEMQSCIIFLYIGFVFFFLLGAYLFEIIPQQFGVKRSPLFPFHSISKLFKKKQAVQIQTQQDEHLRDYISEHQEDQFSKKERQKVLGFRSQQQQDQIKNRYPLIINNMRKLYHKNGLDEPYPAVRSFNLAIAKNQTFGLLGPNGAGKTTLISMITGMYEPNNGNAWIGGYDIKSNIEKAQLEMGVCPQFDLVWPQLSVQEHLYFYARLKGIPERKIKKQVQDSIKEVKLQKFSKFAARQLSGGMKRRLSVAISLVGNPKIVFLDEPSTGLDPDNRRQLWAVLSQCQNKRAIFITTHMMQQADTLCNRVGIITSGVLRTIQTPMKLKKFYGQGYDVVINTIKQERTLISRESLHIGLEEQGWYNEDEKIRASINSFAQENQARAQKINQSNRKIVQFMKKQFPGTYLNKHFNGYLIFKIPSTYKISNLFESMNLVEKELGFSDISITNSSLENVFMNVVGKFDAEGANEYLGIAKNDESILSGEPSTAKQEEKISSKKSLQKSSDKFQSIPASKQSKNEQFESIISKKRESVLSELQAVSPSQSQQREANDNNNQQISVDDNDDQYSDNDRQGHNRESRNSDY